MEWIQVFTIVMSNVGLFLWFRGESRSDWRHIDEKTDAFRQDVQREMKDFHGRLCAIEARRLELLEKR